MQIAAAAAACIAVDDFAHLHASSLKRSRALHVSTSEEPLSLLSPLQSFKLHRHVSRSGTIVSVSDAQSSQLVGGGPGSPRVPSQAPPSLQLAAQVAVQITMQLRVHKSTFTLLDEACMHLENVPEPACAGTFYGAAGGGNERGGSGTTAGDVCVFSVSGYFC